MKLEGFMKRKAAREKMMASEPGLSFDVARRLDSLKHMRDHYIGKTSEEDINSSINIKALIAANRSRKIDWYNGEKFTIWAKGKLLRGPIEFSSANLGALYREYEDTDGLWDASSGRSFFGNVETIPPAMGAGRGLTQHYVTFALKVPGTGDELASIAEFRDDTGAAAPVPPSDGQRSCSLSGAWWRHMLYTATVPDNRKRLYAAQEKGELCDAIPRVDWMIARAPTVPPTREPSIGLESAPAPVYQQSRENSRPLEPWMPDDYQPGNLRPPTYLQYLEWLEGHNRDLPEGEERLIPTWDNYQQHRLIQAHWTTQRDARMQPPTWDQYVAYVHRQNLATEAETPLAMQPRYMTSDLPGYFEYRLDQRNWTAEAEGNSDNNECLVQ
ncbi:uncharacterized protein N7483_012630 [Penicillium malachiteum]|uniref:uncharacterized protein n=1 Tax=Penicillium malachiteum TaxID=1324776 RepID=UPI0025475A1D|nr:uncharacterized protein N7483_012630 [Penicillium malachiteum]KAJ5715449.1 hypothetical protein N7483_012630 [Penicillium malachiteum]